MTNCKSHSHRQRLSLHGTGVTAKGLAHLASLPKLDDLNLSGCDLGDEAVEPLRKLRLMRLNLYGTRISDEVWAQLFPAE
jgi:Leucine Rich Repeat (LRR) protein